MEVTGEAKNKLTEILKENQGKNLRLYIKGYG
jgi:Fe-S cluster assembly iron-binding protein IscA